MTMPISSRPSPPERLSNRGVGKIESHESFERAVWRPHLMSMAIPIASRGMLAAPGEHRVELLAEPARRHCYIDLMRETLLGLPFETVEAAGHGGSRLQIGHKRRSRRSRSPAGISKTAHCVCTPRKLTMRRGVRKPRRSGAI